MLINYYTTNAKKGYIRINKSGMNIINFAQEFPDEESCRSDFKSVREKQGVVCKKCQCTKHWWLNAKRQWKCAKCGFRTTLRSGTFMQNSNLPIRKWYLAMAFMSFSKKGVSATELQRQIGHKHYVTVWFLMHRIREAMGERDSQYTLVDMIEFDEAAVVTATSKKDKNELKKGRGSQRISNIAVAAESIPLEDIKTGQLSNLCRYFKMQKLESYKSEEIDNFIEENVDPASVVTTDKSTSYLNIEGYVEEHITVKSDKVTTQKSLKWVHIAISNVKRNLLGIYHRIDDRYLQNYLDEFCYKLNRRYFGDKLFDRLIIAVAGPKGYDS